jgi:molybdopterin-biosynthesis enzyme MoeA-like protein
LVDYYFADTLLPSLPHAKKYVRKLIGTSLMESDIADALTRIQGLADQVDIKIGSYPKWRPVEVPLDQWKLKVVVSILGKDKVVVDQFAQMVKESVNGFETEDSTQIP